MKFEGKPKGDQDYRSERISVMVARQDSGENQGNHSWKDAKVGTGETMVEDLKGRERRELERDDQRKGKGLGYEKTNELVELRKAGETCQYISEKITDRQLTVHANG
jgi:hypothetical protein